MSQVETIQELCIKVIKTSSNETDLSLACNILKDVTLLESKAITCSLTIRVLKHIIQGTVGR